MKTNAPSLQSLIDFLAGRSAPELAERFRDPDSAEGRMLSEVGKLRDLALRQEVLEATAPPFEEVFGADEIGDGAVKVRSAACREFPRAAARMASGSRIVPAPAGLPRIAAVCVAALILLLSVSLQFWLPGFLRVRRLEGDTEHDSDGPSRTIAASAPPSTRDRSQQPPFAKVPFDQRQAMELQQAWAAYLGRKVEEVLDLGGGVTIELVLIPPGRFTMGSPQEERERALLGVPAERKFELTQWMMREVQRDAAITRPFYLGKYAVTQEQYECLGNRNHSHFSANGAGAGRVEGLDTRKHPAERVSWEEAASYCMRLEALTRHKVGLPTEAEWEYACRGGTNTDYSFGNDTERLEEFAWFANNADYRTHAVGQKRPNPWGLYDMHGNVRQWCQDWYSPAYEGLPLTDPLRVRPLGQQNARVVRGSSWASLAPFCRSAVRSGEAPGMALAIDVGFRVAIRLD